MDQRNGARALGTPEKPLKFDDMAAASSTRNPRLRRILLAYVDLLDTSFIPVRAEGCVVILVRLYRGLVSIHPQPELKQCQERRSINSVVECRTRLQTGLFWWKSD